MGSRKKMRRQRKTLTENIKPRRSASNANRIESDTGRNSVTNENIVDAQVIAMTTIDVQNGDTQEFIVIIVKGTPVARVRTIEGGSIMKKSEDGTGEV